MRKRKAYRPRERAVSPLAYLQSATPEQQATQEARLLLALEALARGANPTPSDWRKLADAINIVETLAVYKTLPAADVIPLCEVAAEALALAMYRSREGKPLRLSGIGLQACQHVIEVLVQAQGLLTHAEMRKAELRTHERIAQALRTNDPALVVA